MMCASQIVATHPQLSPPLQPVAWNMPIQYRWQTQSHHHLDQQHKVIYPLRNDCQFSIHSPSLPGNSTFDQPITRMMSYQKR